RGAAGEEEAKADGQILSPLFGQVRRSSDAAPQCAVLFLSCEVSADGRIVGRTESLRELIRSAGAYVAVVASENRPEHYMKCLGPRDGWGADIVLAMERTGGHPVT